MDNKILVTRNVNCSSLTKEKFVELMTEDLKKAVIEYDNYWLPIDTKRYNENVSRIRANTLKRAIEFAAKKWKTEKKRQAYIDREMANFKGPKFYYDALEYFDFDLTPWSNGLSGDCILRCDNISSTNLERCYDEIKDNKYFKRGLGWILEDHHHSRPQIKLILPPEVQEEFDADEKSLEEAISNFYSGCTYFGD